MQKRKNVRVDDLREQTTAGPLSRVKPQDQQ